MRKTVAFGFVGTVLDYAGRGSQRWSKWRPTLCLCQRKIVGHGSTGIVVTRPLALAI